MMADYYRKAPKKREALEYLAEVNDCSKDDIKKQLMKRGIKFPGRIATQTAELPPVVDDIPITDEIEVPDKFMEDVKRQLNPILVVTPDMIKSRAFTYMVEFFNEDAPKDYIEGFMYGVSMVLGMIK